MSEANSQHVPAPEAPPTPKKNHAWIYFFVFIFVASLSMAAAMIAFNLYIQLKPEQLEAAEKLWKEKGPRNYNMVYTEQVNNDERKTVFGVKVRDGKVTEVTMNGKPLEPTTEDGVERDPRPYHSMDALFRNIQRFMDLDQKKDAPRVYVTAIFDPDTGAIRRYIRRVMGSTQRVALEVEIEPVK